MDQPLLRFGLHDFLNALPILNPLLENGKRAGLDIVVDVPSALADRLKSADLDLAMIPTVEYLREAQSYQLVPGLCIASRGEVGTVLLVTRGPLDKVRSLAVDNRSRTSFALMKILYADTFPAQVEFHPASPDLEAMLQAHDAALIIGDQALALGESAAPLSVFDLSDEWFRRTGKTFVHAVVAVRAGVRVPQKILNLLRQAGLEGHEQIDSIVKTYADQSGLDARMCEDYLRRKIIYGLGDEELEGLLHFRDLCRERQLIPQQYPVTFIQ